VDESFLDPHIIPKPGKDYGWDVIAYGREYSGGETADKMRALLKQ